jgi:hypothetical protein
MEDTLLIMAFVIRACKLLQNNNLKQLVIAMEDSFILAKEGEKGNMYSLWSEIIVGNFILT